MSGLEIDWERYGGTLSSFDDGHVPETLESTSNPTQLVDYPAHFGRDPQVLVYADAMPEDVVDAAYTQSVDALHPAWGDYVMMDQVLDYWQPTKSSHTSTSETPKNEPDPSLSIALAAHYLRLVLGEGDQPPSQRIGAKNRTPLFPRQDLKHLHGVAVWGLAAQIGSQVPYHLDYAEQIRYDSNTIVPPLLAGTLHCTRNSLEGGDFVVSLDGIDHYRRHGYKCHKEPLNMGNMKCIAYHFNQLTCHLGNLPHASTEIRAIHGNQHRVIVGFNVFGHDVGSIVQKAPEHSAKFRRKVQVQRLLFGNPKSLSLASLKKNKPLTKLLVLAKRERIKQEYRTAQQHLAEGIPKKLPATVQELMDHFYSKNSCLCWPASPVDVQVYLHHQIRQGHYRIVSPGEDLSSSIISLTATIDLKQAATR